jgi:hypothetical protein
MPSTMRASAGLIISEATQISPEGQGYISTPGIHSTEQIKGWKCVTKASMAGGHIVLQLWHVGRISHPSFQPGAAAPVAPLAIKPNGQAFTEKGFEPIPTPRALEMAEIPVIVEQQYAQAARNALAAGFDGVEVLAANGYLIDQFCATRPTNARIATAVVSEESQSVLDRSRRRSQRRGNRELQQELKQLKKIISFYERNSHRRARHEAFRRSRHALEGDSTKGGSKTARRKDEA